jgi:hypothetical protein
MVGERHGNGVVCVNYPLAACRRDLYLIEHDTYKIHVSKFPAGFEPATPVSEPPKTQPQTAQQLGSGLDFCWELNVMNSQWICSLPNHLCSLDTLRMFSHSHFMISLKIVLLFFVANWPHHLAVRSVTGIVLDCITTKYDSRSHYFPRQSQMKIFTNVG